MKLLITGALGHIGSRFTHTLERNEFDEVCLLDNLSTQRYPSLLTLPRDINFSFLEKDITSTNLEPFFETVDVVIHLAARVGGIGANQEHPGTFIHDNLIMGVNLIESCKFSVEKFVLAGTVCSYPKYASVPFEESKIWDGYPEETNAPYGVAKKTLTVMLEAYRGQYGLNGITAIPVNMYGPHDNFKPESSHVIPALIKKIEEAGASGDLEIWGTGNASREFLHVRDSARGIVMAAESYNDPSPVNLGTYDEIKICELVNLLREIMGHKGEVRYNRDKPDGQPRRCLLTSKAKSKFGFSAEIPLREGLEETVHWYLSNKEVAV